MIRCFQSGGCVDQLPLIVDQVNDLGHYPSVHVGLSVRVVVSIAPLNHILLHIEHPSQQFDSDGLVNIWLSQ